MTTIRFCADVKGQILNEFDFLLSDNELRRHLAVPRNKFRKQKSE